MKRESSTGDADSEAHVPSQLPAEDTSPASTAEQEEVNRNIFKFMPITVDGTQCFNHISYNFISTPLFLAS